MLTHTRPAGAAPPIVGGRRGAYFAAMVVDTVGTGLWTPFSLIFFTHAQGIPLAQAGAALTAGGVAGLVVGMVTGGLVDRHGPSLAILVSKVLRAGPFLLYPSTHSAWVVALLATVYVSGDRLFWTSSAPFLRDMATGRELDRLLATQSTLRIAGLGIGAAGAGVLAGSPEGLRLVAYLNAATFVAAGVLFCFAAGLARLTGGRTGGAVARTGLAGWRVVVRDRPFLMLCAVQSLFALATGSLVFLLPLVSVTPLGGPLWLPAAVAITSNAVMALTQRPLVRAAERTTRMRGVLASAVPLVLSAVALAFGALADPGAVPWLVLGAAALGALGQGVCSTLLIAAATDAAPDDLRGRYNAVYQAAFGFANVLTPAVFTALLAVSNAVMWASVACLVLLALPCSGPPRPPARPLPRR
ncbi:MFS transporter [Actinokineospora soli]|uniref:MFS transporter n=1 Tax=Actinokineospora soli TaxID=1048753 RepID=A0ABW2TR90_9PSEU